MLCDAHCHFFSARYLELLTQGTPAAVEGDAASAVCGEAGMGSAGDAGRARRSLGSRARSPQRRPRGADRQHSGRRVLGARRRGAASVAPGRLLHVQPGPGNVRDRLDPLLADGTLRAVALFPAMHHYRLDDAVVADVFDAAKAAGAAVFVHCGVLTVGVRKRLGLAVAVRSAARRSARRRRGRVPLPEPFR